MFDILESFKEQTGHDIGDNVSFIKMNDTQNEKR